jgi:hypothetical protein
MSLEQPHYELLSAGMPLYLKRAKENSRRSLQLIEEQERVRSEKLDAAMRLYFQYVKISKN